MSLSFLNGVFDLPWWGYVLVTLGLTHVTIAAVTIFLHRHQAHRALDLHPIPSHFFRFWLWLTTGMVTKEWAAIHRKHHAKCETAEDPHSPQVFGINRVLWGGVFLYVKESYNKETMERYGHGTPDDWIERNVYQRFAIGGLTIMGLVNVALFGIIPGLVILVTQIVWIPFWAAGVINGVGHFWGYRNYNCADASTNIFPWGIFIGGEELHNNHHAFATSARLSNRWFEVDIGWLYIRILSALGQARVKKLAPTLRLGKPRTEIDGETLQALITYRYDMLARYAHSLKAMYRDELKRVADGARYRGLKRCLAMDAAAVPQELRSRLDELLATSGALATAYSMRDELKALWERSSASSEQLVRDLQDWCARAESSGIRQLEELSLRLRRYAVVAA
jgi:stearoyl-CoA desaturase (delta-9 desaturase)